MAIQGPRPRPSPSNSAAVASLPRPTSPDLPTDSDDDATSSGSDDDVSVAHARENVGKGEPTARRDLDGKIYDDRRKPRPRNRENEQDLIIRAVQERVRIQSLLYDTTSPTASMTQKLTAPPVSRVHLRLALATLRARQFLASRSFSQLSTALNEISKGLLSLGGPDALAKTMHQRRRPERIAPVETTAARTKPTLGVFVPILARLVEDVRTALMDADIKGRESRRNKLSRDEAKALVALRQRWVVKPAGGKSTGRVGKRNGKDLEWVERVEKLVAENPPPACLLPPSTANNNSLEEEGDHRNKTSSLLTSIEQLLLPAALPRISLSALDLDDRDFDPAQWSALEGVEDVVGWYLSFGNTRQSAEEDGKVTRKEEDKARAVLDGVKVLDLSHNRLADFPRHLVHLFPNLEALSLSHNRFTRLPPWITLFSSLRRLETDHNPLVSLANPNRNRNGRAGAGAGERKEDDDHGAVRANPREMYAMVEDAVRRTVAQVSKSGLLLALRRHQSTRRRVVVTGGGIIEGPPPSPRSLFSLSVELAQTHLISSSPRELTLDDSLSTIPPHLLETVSTSYRCISCDRFVTMPDDSAWFVPPFWERVYFLNPGIVITSSSDGSRRRNRTRRRRRPEQEDGDDGDREEEEEEHVEHHLDAGSSSSTGRGDSGAGKSATLEQRLLLAVLARQEQGSLPRPDQGSRRSSGGGGGGHKNASSSSSRFFDSDYGRHSRSTDDDDDADDDDPAAPTGSSAVIRTFVLGGRGPYGVGSRFCALCAASHLGVRDAVLASLARERDEGSEGDGRSDVVASWRCGCEMCKEERRVRDAAPEGEGEEEDHVDERSKVVRWLRRYDAVRQT